MLVMDLHARDPCRIHLVGGVKLRNPLFCAGCNQRLTNFKPPFGGGKLSESIY